MFGASTDLQAILPITLGPLAKIFALSLIGALLWRFKVLDSQGVDTLTRLVVQLLLPLLIFTEVVDQFRPEAPEYAGWSLMPLVAILTIGAALGFAVLPARLLCAPQKRRPFAAMLAFHNAGYIPLALIDAIYGQRPELAAAHDHMLVLLFLYLLGQSPLLWLLGVSILRKTREEGARGPAEANGLRRWLGILSPPFVANVAAIGLCLLRVPQSVPAAWVGALLSPLKLLGQCTTPVIMVTLGAMLGELDFSNRPAKREIGSLALLRLMALPGAGYLILAALLHAGLLPRSWAMLLFLQTLTPTATNLAVMARAYGSDEASDFVNHSILVLYVASLATIPFWLTLWAAKIGLNVG